MSFNIRDKVIYAGEYYKEYSEIFGRTGRIIGERGTGGIIGKHTNMNSVYYVKFASMNDKEETVICELDEDDLQLCDDSIENSENSEIILIKKTLSELLKSIEKECYSVSDEYNCVSKGMFFGGIQEVAREIEDKMIYEVSK